MTAIEKPVVVVLAAGQGKRMKSPLPKVAVSTVEKPMIQHILTEVEKVNPERLSLVIGHAGDVVKQTVLDGASKGLYTADNIFFSEQKEQLGTGHAVGCAESDLDDFNGPVLILYGDVPLITAETLDLFLEAHAHSNATITVLSTVMEAPGSLGRIIRSKEDNSFKKIVEAADCSAEELLVKEINTGFYVVDSAFLWAALKNINNDNKQGEYYLTDIIEIAEREGQKVSLYCSNKSDEFIGVNSRVQLAEVNQLLQKRVIDNHLENGVEFEDTHSVFIEPSVKIESGACIGPFVKLVGDTHIKSGVRIEGSVCLINTIVHEGVLLKFGVRAEDSEIGSDSAVGPFAHLRPESVLGKGVKIGNFVETKKSVLNDNVSVSHLSYLGDSSIGSGTNIGAGTITCNYNGKSKHRTIIEENVFVGSNSVLVAPVTLRRNSYVGAGSVIQEEVGENSLALTRAPLKVKKDYIPS